MSPYRNIADSTSVSPFELLSQFSMSKDVVSKDVVSKDVVSKDVVSKDVVSKDFALCVLECLI